MEVGSQWSSDYPAGSTVEFKSDSGKTLIVYSPSKNNYKSSLLIHDNTVPFLNSFSLSVISVLSSIL